MARTMLACLLGLVTISCAATTGAPKTSASAASQCESNSTRCTANDQCCSLWCVNGYCERREP